MHDARSRARGADGLANDLIAGRRLVRVAGEDAAREAKGPGTFHANLYDALYNLEPKTLDDRARIEDV